MVTSAAQIEEQQKQQQQEEELKRLAIEKSQCIQRAKQLTKDHDKTWKQEINILAQIMEKELNLLGQQALVNNISIEIARLYRENDIKIWPWVHDYLPSRFKRGQPRQLPEQSSTSNNSEVSTLDQAIENLHALTHNVDQISAQQIAEIHKSAKQIQQQCKKRADLEHIALMPDDNSSSTDQINDGKEGNRDHVTIDKPKPHGSLTYDALTEIITDLTQVKDRVFEFPPEILEKDEEIATGWKTWGTWMKPALDLKYSKSWLDWFRTEKYRDVYGKHAAAVMSFSLTNLCANCSDEKTKEWVRMEPIYANTFASYQCLQCQYKIDTVCPNCNLAMKHLDKPIIGWQCSECESTTPLTRDLTREQVGDKSSIIIDAAINVLDHIPSQVAFCAWYSDWIEPRIGGRKIRLGPDLSDKA